MVILKKIRAASLVEILIASAIIMIVFFIGSLTLNNVFKNSSKTNTFDYNNRLKEVRYLVTNKVLVPPFYEETEQWEISVEQNGQWIIIASLHKISEEKQEIKVNAID